MFQDGFGDVSRKFLGCLNKVLSVFQEKFRKKFQGCLKKVSSMFQENFKQSVRGVSRMFQ